MTLLPQSFKRIRAQFEEFPNGSTRRGYEFVAPLGGNEHTNPTLCRSIAAVAGYAGSGAMRRKVRSTQAGCAATIRRRKMTTRPVTGSALTRSGRANMSQFATTPARCIPSG